MPNTPPPSASMIPIAQAQRMIRAYINAPKNGGIPQPIPQSGWFAADTLSAYFDYVKERCQDLDIEFSGFRYFFAIYTEDTDFGPVNQKGYMTIVILPTTTTPSINPGQSGQRAFVPELSAPGKPAFFNVNENLKSESTGQRTYTPEASALVISGSEGLALNKSQMCPPYNCQ